MKLKGWIVEATRKRLEEPLEDHLKYLFDQGLTTREIAEQVGVNYNTIYPWLKKLGLTRSPREANLLAWEKGRWDREESRKRAYSSGFHKAFKGRECPWKGQHLPEKWRDNISRGMTGTRVGPNHPLWKGGISPKNYGPGWKPGKRAARKKAAGKCEKCGQPTDPSWRHDVHHIVPFRLFQSPQNANRPWNLIVLCRQCHKDIEKETYHFLDDW